MDLQPDTSPVPDYMSALRLDGRGVIVFGAGQGIGRQVSHALHQAGAKVVCVDKDAVLADRIAQEVEGIPVAADITDRDAVQGCFDQAERALSSGVNGIIDIVGEARLTTFDEATDALWTSQFDIVTKHAFLVTQIGRRALARSGGGAISLVGSLSGRRMLTKQSIYGPAKAALHHLVRCAAVEMAGDNIRVNAVAPGFVRTPRLDQMISAAKWAQIEAAIPVGRAAQPHEIAKALLFLTSDLGIYVTGQIIGMDGGLASGTPLPVLFE
jgi:NAD(P)-dependent dehydrogenase (short-subunit alcohol dehydrogenase family)